MKPILFILMFALLNSSCKKEAKNTEFEKSYNKWLSFKAETQNSYRYFVTTSSWVGIADSTIITIQGGYPIAREYKRYSYGPANGLKTKIESWEETAQTLNTHEGGASPVTLDEIYEKARTEWLKANRKDNTIIFEAENEGLISSCGYIPKNCADDCFFGIRIVRIEPIVIAF